MDFNAGVIADGHITVEQAGEDLFSMILAVASGVLTKSEELGLGDEEFAPWQIGPIV
jgi:altronate hydrolase